MNVATAHVVPGKADWTASGFSSPAECPRLLGFKFVESARQSKSQN